MALIVKQTVCVKCSVMYLIDNTGSFDINTNPTGYGDPNPIFGMTTPYTVDFFPPNSDTSTDDPKYTLDLLADPPMPDADGFYNYPINPADMGYDAYFPGGHWQGRVTLGDTVSWIQVFVIDEIQEKVVNCLCAAPDTKWRCMIQLQKDLESACALFKSYQFVKAQKAMDKLYRDTTDCCCVC